jgi:cysteine desulfurase
METEMVYLDHNATTPVRPEVFAALLPYLKDNFANPNSPYRIGQEARKAVEEARIQTARLVGALNAQEIIFTSSGSESNAAAIYGAAWQVFHQSGGKKNQIICSSIEHDSVREILDVLWRQGFKICEVEVSGDGMVDVGAISNLLGDLTALVSVMHANNEVGTIQPIEEIAAICRERGTLFHSDAVQSAGKIEIQAAQWGVDLLSISGHKLGAPKGVAALYVRNGLKLFPLIAGLQEKRRRGGTENVSGIVGLGEAARLALADLNHGERYISWRKRIEDSLLSIPGVRLNGHTQKRLPNTAHFSIEGVDGHSLSISLDLNGICVSGGSACATGLSSPSHVLRAMGLPKNWTKGALRVSMGWSTSQEDVERFLAIAPNAIERLRSSLAKREQVESPTEKMLRPDLPSLRVAIAA